MKRQRDERVESQVHRIGYEAFTLIMIACAALMVVNQILLNKGPGVETWILLGGCFYYSIRTLSSGASEIPTEKAGMRRLSRKIILSLSLTSLAFGLVISIRNCILYQGGHYNIASLAVLIITTVGMMTLSLFALIVYMAVSVRMSRKFEE